jgi:cytosine/uracil/thiamine/allantoin permease
MIEFYWQQEPIAGIMVSPEMVRRFAALAGIILILAVVTALVWTVHQHKMKTVLPDDATDVISSHVSQPRNEESI